MDNKTLKDLTICIKSGGDLATGVVARLYKAGFKRLVLLETERPLAVRRNVSFAEAVYNGTQTVEGITAQLCQSTDEFESVFATGKIVIIVDPQWTTLKKISPDVVVDAILAKRNLGTTKNEAPLVIGLGPGFNAGSTPVRMFIALSKRTVVTFLVRRFILVPHRRIPVPPG